jgi:hypothetical protein
MTNTIAMVSPRSGMAQYSTFTSRRMIR